MKNNRSAAKFDQVLGGTDLPLRRGRVARGVDRIHYERVVQSTPGANQRNALNPLNPTDSIPVGA
jgi:hypothetical protein